MPTDEGTEYVVLFQLGEGRWQYDGAVVARDASTAIRKTYESRPTPDPGIAVTFVAVPSRSWSPVKVTPKVETTLVLEDVTA